MTHKPTARPGTPVYLTEERLAIRDLAREFTAKEVLPVANALDPEKGDIPVAPVFDRGRHVQARRNGDGRARHLPWDPDPRRRRLHHRFQVERHWRDARLTRIFEGTSEIQMRIISDALLGRSS